MLRFSMPSRFAVRPHLYMNAAAPLYHLESGLYQRIFHHTSARGPEIKNLGRGCNMHHRPDLVTATTPAFLTKADAKND